MYQTYNEAIGIEGTASEKIISIIIKNNFIRLRRVRVSKFSKMWFADVNDYDSWPQETLSDWAYTLASGGVIKDLNELVNIYMSDNNLPRKFTYGELLNNKKNHSQLKLINLIEMKYIM
jgi:hypothetical protein